MVTTRNSSRAQRATGASSSSSQSGHTTPRSRREATSSSDRPNVITVLSDDDNDFQDLILPVRRRRMEPTTTTPVRSSKRLKQRDQGAAEGDRKGKGKGRMTLPTPIVSSDDSTTSTPTADLEDTVQEPLEVKQEDVEPTASHQSIKQEHGMTTLGQQDAKLLEDTLENVVVCKGELDELGEAILKQNASAAMTTPQEDDEKPKDEEHDIKDEDDEKPKDEEQDVKDEDDDLGATLVEQDMVDGTLVHDEEALNATLEDIKGESSSSSTDIGASSPTPGFDDASSTTTAGTLNPNNIRLSVPPTDTEAEDDDTSTIEDEDEEALLDQPPRRFPGTVNPSRANINAKRTTRKLLAHHPELANVWDELDNAISAPVKPVEQPEKLKLSLLPFQRHGVGWMRQQEEINDFKGGILADEMGMGKTIQTIALLLSDEESPNLVVAPTVALMQWKHEIEKHTNNALKVCVFHGDKRPNKVRVLLDHDVVLTTYSVVETAFRYQEHGRTKQGKLVKEKSILHQVQWHRIILDEAHNIKARSSNTARAVFNFESKFKWSLTGTPLQNRVGELYSLIRFMQADPFAYYYCKDCPCKTISWQFSDGKSCDQCGHRPMDHTCWWNNEVLKPIQHNGYVGEGRIAMEKLGKLLDKMMLRRTKVQCADDLGLPPRKVVVRRDYFSAEEEEVYRSLFSDSARQFSAYVEQGSVLNNYANIFELLTKMRQSANHPDLVLRKTGDDQQLVCMLCSDTPEDAIRAHCRHIFCRDCCIRYLASFDDEEAPMDQGPKCPTCFAHFLVDLSQPTVELQHEAGLHATYAKTSIVNRINMDKWRSSTKIEALVEELSKLQAEDRTIKSIVFSQFVNFLDLVYWRLSRAGFECIRLDGTMSPQQRDAAIKHFNNKPSCTVFLISLKAGGVALNLVEASRVFICDPWWNPAVELQAMDRIHRLGQRRPIKITRLIIENSIENRIVQLQDKKTALVDSTVGRDTSALDKLSAEDLQFLFVM